MALLHSYMQALKGQKKIWLLVLASYIVFFTGARVVLRYVIALFIESIAAIDESTQMNDFAFYIGLVVGTHVVISVVGQVGVFSYIKAKTQGARAIENDAFARLTKHSQAFYNNRFSGALVAQFNRYVKSFITIADAITADFLALAIEFVVPLGIIFFISPLLAGMYAVTFFGVAGSLIFLHKKKIVHSEYLAEQESTKTGLLADVIANIFSVKTFAARERELNVFGSKVSGWAAAFRTEMIYSNRIRLFKIAAWIFFDLITLWLVAQQAITGKLSVAEALVVVLYVGQLSQSLWNFGKVVERVERAVADGDEMLQVLNTPVEVTDSLSPLEAQISEGKIDFADACFAYGADAATAHKAASLASTFRTSISATIEAGEKVGVVGPSGGGKSTLFTMLLRFADLESGRITIDGQNIADLRQGDLRSAIAYVPQEPVLFHRSIKENILYGSTEVSQEEFAEVLHLAHVNEFVDALPEGVDTLVGERGVKLSGGQKQRIAIARAMVKPAPILLLDEATSALDSRSEHLIIEALDALMANRTTLVVAHRLSTVRNLDRIIVLEQGRIVEDGGHNELLSQNGRYAHLWNHQTQEYATS